MFQKIILLNIIIFFFGVNAIVAQDSLQILNAQLVLASDNLTGLDQYTEDELLDMEESIIDSIFANRAFSVATAIHVTDTGNIQTIHVRIGRTQGGSDLANIAVSYNGVLPTGVLGILKNDDDIQIEFGNHSNTASLYLQVWIDDKNGNTTPVFYASNL